MVSERPVCVYAMAGLKRNSTRLMVVMCVGIALAFYGVYVQARSSSNPNYMPTMSVAANWFYHGIGRRLAHPSMLMSGCASNARHVFKPSVGQLIMHRFIYPVMRYSGVANGLINLAQIVLLKVCCKSFAGTNAIIGLSALGLVISLLCLIGSFASCRLMCISCLGVHHAAIIYLAMRRSRILKNILCPTENINPGACAFGNNSSAASSAASNSNSIAAQTAAKHSSSCTTRRRKDDNNGSGRRSTAL